VGPTGSGKTTLVMLIPRLYDVEHGSVLVDGVDVRRLDPASLRREVAVVSDDAFLFSAPLGENIAYARPEATDDEIRDAALQYVRKISGFTKASQANEEAFARAVDAIADASHRLIHELVTNAPPKDREVEAEKRRARARRSGHEHERGQEKARGASHRPITVKVTVAV